jgi:alanine racemase
MSDVGCWGPDRANEIANSLPEQQERESLEAFPAAQLTAVVDLAALRHNLKLIRQSLADDQEVIACVKANAYGHGLRAVAECLQGQGVRWLAIASPGEALALRRWGITCRILLFPTVGDRADSVLAACGITIGIQSYEEAEAVARAVSGPVSIFLKVDTGLARFGVSTADVASVTDRIKSKLPSVKLNGIFTHLPFSGVSELPWIEDRTREFGRAVSEIRKRVELPFIVQAFSSGGVAFGLKSPETNAVCPGQLLFGIEPANLKTHDQTHSLGSRPVLQEVRTVLGALRSIPSGTRFGFGGAFLTSRETRLGVLPVGFSNSILVAREGQVANLLGRVAPILMVGLEHAVVDVTGIPGVHDGCSVTLLARDSALGVTLDRVAQLQQRPAVETLTSLTARATYEYVDPEFSPTA